MEAEFYSISDAARLLGVHRNTMRQWIYEKKIRGVSRINSKCVRIPKTAITTMLRETRQKIRKREVELVEYSGDAIQAYFEFFLAPVPSKKKSTRRVLADNVDCARTATCPAATARQCPIEKAHRQ